MAYMEGRGHLVDYNSCSWNSAAVLGLPGQVLSLGLPFVGLFVCLKHCLTTPL